MQNICILRRPCRVVQYRTCACSSDLAANPDAHFSAGLRQLQQLSLAGCDGITRTTVSYLSGAAQLAGGACPSLLSGRNVSDHSIAMLLSYSAATLRQHVPSLPLHVSTCPILRACHLSNIRFDVYYVLTYRYNHFAPTACRSDAADVGEPGAVQRCVRHAVPAGCALRSVSSPDLNLFDLNSSDGSWPHLCITGAGATLGFEKHSGFAVQTDLSQQGIWQERSSPTIVPCRDRAAAAGGAGRGFVPAPSAVSLRLNELPLPLQGCSSCGS